MACTTGLARSLVASRWAAETHGLFAPPEMWSLYCPTAEESGPLAGEEVLVLKASVALPAVTGNCSFDRSRELAELQGLPRRAERRIRAELEALYSDGPRDPGNRGSGWPKGKAKEGPAPVAEAPKYKGRGRRKRKGGGEPSKSSTAALATRPRRKSSGETQEQPKPRARRKSSEAPVAKTRPRRKTATYSQED